MSLHPARGRPLDGIVILDLSQAAAGPICGSYLAAMGAEVIKIERPGYGDMARRTPPYATAHGIRAQRAVPEDISSVVLKRNRGKKSITLDLQKPEGLKIFLDLLPQADVVLENFRPGVSTKLGIDYERLIELKPDLIYCSITGFGMSGPYKTWSAFDTIIQGMTGVMAATGQPDGPPTKAGLLVGDTVAPLYAMIGIMAALRMRDRTGVGEFVEVSMFDCLVSMLWDEPLEYFAANDIRMRSGNRFLRMAPWNSYPASDGHVVICAGQQDHWIRVCKLIGRPELVEDPRYASMEARLDHVAEVDALVEAWTATRTRAEIVERCQADSIPCGPISELPDLIADPHLQARGLLKPLMHPLHGAIPGAHAVDFPVRYGNMPPPDPAPAPMLGQHTVAILQERLKLSREQIDKLVALGVIDGE
jgi:crotonobetainyl-CoA:carnitine CoA-transferase CaiB-like acyl-CoA transferase